LPRPTQFRYAVLAVTTLTAILLYLDRICLSQIAESNDFQRDLGVNKQGIGWISAAFFFAYAISQVPSGWLSDRFGARGMMAFYVALWSLFTGLGGLTIGFASLLITRLGMGIAQAGAYPTSGGLLSRWIPFSERGVANSIVALGGRIGMALTPLLTAYFMAWFHWRATLVVYGLAGIFVAGLFYWVFRERPEQHPRVNRAECALIESGKPPGVATPHGRARRAPVGAMLRNRSLWCMSISMFCTNIGWAFLATWLPTYFKEVKHLSSTEGARVATLSLLGGLAGVMCGGYVADYAARKLPLRWARSVPLVASRFLAMTAYIVALQFDSVWIATAAFAVVAFGTDLGTAATWSYAQDVGGRHVGSVLGWSNMWGNIGAAVITVLLPLLIAEGEKEPNWDAAFILCAVGFLVAAVASLGIDASRPIECEAQPASR
jgi:ACS family glucarate transporter-like MFS transporter